MQGGEAVRSMDRKWTHSLDHQPSPREAATARAGNEPRCAKPRGRPSREGGATARARAGRQAARWTANGPRLLDAPVGLAIPCALPPPQAPVRWCLPRRARARVRGSGRRNDVEKMSAVAETVIHGPGQTQAAPFTLTPRLERHGGPPLVGGPSQVGQPTRAGRSIQLALPRRCAGCVWSARAMTQPRTRALQHVDGEHVAVRSVVAVDRARAQRGSSR